MFKVCYTIGSRRRSVVCPDRWTALKVMRLVLECELGSEGYYHTPLLHDLRSEESEKCEESEEFVWYDCEEFEF